MIRSDLVGDPASFSLLVGFFGWVIAMVAAAVAFRSAGASWPIVVLIGMAAIFAIHPPPVGPIQLACFAAAAVLVERSHRGDSGAQLDDPTDPIVPSEAFTN